jgi:hypothetical protein
VGVMEGESLLVASLLAGRRTAVTAGPSTSAWQPSQPSPLPLQTPAPTQSPTHSLTAAS